MEMLSDHYLIEVFNKTKNNSKFDEEFIRLVFEEIVRRKLRVASCKATKECLLFETIEKK